MRRTTILIGLISTALVVPLILASMSSNSEAQQTKKRQAEITGVFKVQDAEIIRFADPDSGVVCYMQDSTGSLSCVK